MPEVSPTSYDEIPYDSRAFSFTHPNRLATSAILAGLTPAPVERCRVLELGCAAGGNLLPMAEVLPESRFVGIDLSGRQIADGQKTIDAAGLRNVELKTMSILDVGGNLGLFDYIICHGVYSWVPPAVQDKILDICKTNLSPNGVAYVSYNTYPGWHMRQMIREMMLYHAGGFSDPREKVRQARALLNLLVNAWEGSATGYTQVLKEELGVLGQAKDHYIFHEHLEAVNEPIYFHQFVARAAAKGLQYLNEARPDLLWERMSPHIKQQLAPLGGDVIRREQYQDFISSRRFRWTLLCHAGLPARHAPDPDAVGKLLVVGFLRPAAPDPDVRSAARVTFVGAHKVEVSSDDPPTKAALTILAESHPIFLRFEVLCREVRRRLTGSADDMPEDERRRVATALLHCQQPGMVELHAYAPPFTLEISEYPRVTPLARLQAAAGPLVTDLRHRDIEFKPLERVILMHLDGDHDRAALLGVLTEAFRSGRLQAEAKTGPPPDPAAIPAILERSIEPALRRIALNTMLIG